MRLEPCWICSEPCEFGLCDRCSKMNSDELYKWCNETAPVDDNRVIIQVNKDATRETAISGGSPAKGPPKHVKE